MIEIEREPWAEMVAHAEATYPDECCGAMLGQGDGEKKIGACCSSPRQCSRGIPKGLL